MTTCCPLTPDVKQELIEVKCKMPSNTDIVDRFLGLFEGRQNRITKLSEEFLKLWEMNFPSFHNNSKLSRQGDKILRKIQKVKEVKYLQKCAPTCMTLQRKCKLALWRLEKVENYTEDRLNQEAERDTRQRKLLLCPISMIHPSKWLNR